MADINPQPTSVQSLYAWYNEDKLFVNRRYQRKLVWTQNEKQKLIESILKKYPIPAILVAEREDVPGTYEIIDGLQRLHAIVSFIENTFSTLDGKVFPVEHFPTAKGRADENMFIPNKELPPLSQKEVTVILDYIFSLTVMRGATEAEVNDVFGRINTYGHRLSDQERRQAGVQSSFSDMVRNISCTLRGDESSDVLLLKSMPSISIDLPMSKHGYDIKANEVVWAREGILRSTDLRDSMDEQCIADIAACIVGGQLIERSKDALDEIYSADSAESQRLENALNIYGEGRFSEEIKFCIDQILVICSADGEREKLRDVVFSEGTTNAFPSIFSVLVIAFHETLIQQKKKISDASGAKKAIYGLDARLEKTRKGTSVEERRKNINTVKGLIDPFCVPSEPAIIYGAHATTDIEAAIRRSEIELSDYELKQGMLSLHEKRPADDGAIEKVINTICAIANNGNNRHGKVIIGVSDKSADTERIIALDGIKPIEVGKRSVVGITREAKAMGMSVEDYVAKWKSAIKASGLSSPLKETVLSCTDFNSYFDLGVLVISIPPQKELSYVAGQVFWREGDSTVLASEPKVIAGLAKRF
jgi:hypothetical protein